MKKSPRPHYKRHRYFLIVFLLVALTSNVVSQSEQTISLDECLTLATTNYPLTKQKAYLNAIGENNQKGINGSWLPQVNFNLRATYQSEVPSFDFEGFPQRVFPKDQYNFGMQVTQTILDGGLTNQQKATDKANTESEIQKNEVELFKVKDRIVQLYGNILLAVDNIDILRSYADEITNRHKKMESSVRNGIILQSDLDELDAEMLKTDQKTIEASSRLKTLCQVLSLFINQTVDENTKFEELPIADKITNQDILRPELTLFSMQQSLIDDRIKLSEIKTRPHLAAFGDGAYGRPGFNFLNQKMRFYGLVGIRLTWNLNSLYTLTYDRNNFVLQQNMIDAQRDLFQLNLNATLLQQNGEIDKLQQMSQIDNAIIEKRKSVSKVKANQLDNGTITSSDYLSELNEEKQAILTQRMHEIQLGIAVATLRITKGN
ncbi:MAG: TolC family protein [Saprospiraceae bacterium]